MCPYSSPNISSRLRARQSARTDFKAFVRGADFPCVGARSALNRDRLRFAHFNTLGDATAALPLRDELAAFAAEFPDPGTTPVSFVATFDSEIGNEHEFERLLWLQLQQLHDVDRIYSPWDASVSAEPDDPEFSMSVAGRAFFVVGMFPTASRIARRAPLPTLVFNFHEQFTLLKESGKYASMQEAIRARDTALQGSINPVLARFGEASEARQYSGRAVEPTWACPFAARSTRHV